MHSETMRTKPWSKTLIAILPFTIINPRSLQEAKLYYQLQHDLKKEEAKILELWSVNNQILQK